MVRSSTGVRRSPPHARRFTGFTRASLALLAELADNNDRAWFGARKARFEAELFEPMRALVADASQALGRARIPLVGDERRSIFRIARDVRFGHDKTPYRTNLAAYLSYDGERATPGGAYIHIQPGASFLSIAFYRLEKPMLDRWRAAMAARGPEFRRILTHLERRGIPLLLPDGDGDALARMPRGYDATQLGDRAPYFRLRSFHVERSLDDDDVTDPRLVEHIVTIAKDARPLLDFGWSIE